MNRILIEIHRLRYLNKDCVKWIDQVYRLLNS